MFLAEPWLSILLVFMVVGGVSLVALAIALGLVIWQSWRNPNQWKS